MLYAASVGVNRYADPDIRDLSCARRDAEAIASMLNEHIRPEERDVRLLVDEQATRRNVETVIGEELPRLARKGDVVLLYFACHGSPEMRGAPNRQSLYLILHDTEYGRIFSTGIDMEVEIIRWLERFAEGTLVLLLLDACFSGGAGGRTFEGPTRQDLRKRGAFRGGEISLKELELGEGRVIIAASDDDQVALENPAHGHGIFTHHLLQTLRQGTADRSTISVTSLYDDVARGVRTTTGGKQVPILNGRSRMAAVPLFPAATPAAGPALP